MSWRERRRQPTVCGLASRWKAPVLPHHGCRRGPSAAHLGSCRAPGGAAILMPVGVPHRFNVLGLVPHNGLRFSCGRPLSDPHNEIASLLVDARQLQTLG